MSESEPHEKWNQEEIPSPTNIETRWDNTLQHAREILDRNTGLPQSEIADNDLDEIELILDTLRNLKKEAGKA
jgi:hypothetical protein